MRRLIATIVCMAITLTSAVTSESKMKKVYLGKVLCSGYSASDNTPSGTHDTSSGAHARAGWTVAVDYRDPFVKMGTYLYVEGFGKMHVEDYGGFGHYNNGQRKLDIFHGGGDFGLKWLKVWKYRKETKAEKKKRLEKRRKCRQKKPFSISHSLEVPYGTIVADPGYIRSGTVQIGYRYYEVSTKKGLGSRLLINDEDLCRYKGQVLLENVAENAVG